MITIQELLYNRGLNKHELIKLVRHKDARCSLYNKYLNDVDWFLSYQNSQAKPVFHNVKYIVSFIGEESCNSRFIGVYEITDVYENTEYDPESLINNRYVYSIVEKDGFDDLKERVVIKWNNPRAWHQWIKNDMEIIRID